MDRSLFARPNCKGHVSDMGGADISILYKQKNNKFIIN